MTTADEILAGAVEATSEGATQDKVLRIDNELRTISIPSTVKLLGVESDKDVNVIEFEMPRHYGEVDLSTFSVRVNYMNANGDGDIYKVTDLVAGEEKMTFSWLVGRTASMYKGDTRFVVCLKKIAEDSTNKQEFNTTIASLPVLQGLEPNEQLIQRYPDIIEQMLKFMEAPISPEEIGKALEEYLKKNPIGGTTINDKEISAESVWSSQKTSTQIDEKVSAHNIDPNAHTDVRELISGLTNRLNALADSDDTTLDQLSEIVAYIKSNKTLIDAITTSKVSVSDIVDDLITNSSNKPLSAAQGVKLKALIDAIVPITVDSVLSSTSTNPVQNRVVLNGLNDKENKGAARIVQIGSNSYTPNESGVIDLSGALSDTKAVLYTEQTLDDAQKTQARKNIGAADEALQNVLVGGETGNPIAVDDAFSAPLRGLTVYGKSTQDGTPSLDNPVPIVSAGDGGTITVTIGDGADEQKTITLPTPNGLPGIPVTSGGNYTDPQGQQWVCDEVDFGKSVKVQRIGKERVNTSDGAINEQYRLALDVPGNEGKDGASPCIISLTPYVSWLSCISGSSLYLKNITKSEGGFYTAEELKTLAIDVDFVYQLATPIETPLTPAEIAAYKALTTYAPDTVVQASDGAGVKLGYQRDVNIATNWKPTVDRLNTDVGQLKSNVNQLKSNVNAKINQSDALTLEEILASTNLTNKVASAEAVKSIKNDVWSVKQGGFYTEYHKGNTMPSEYGGFIRITGSSWPGSFVSDTYYLGVASDSIAYSGAQINGAKQVTWKAL